MPAIPTKIMQAHRVKGSKRRGRNLSNAYHAKLLAAAQRLAVAFVAPEPIAQRVSLSDIRRSELRQLAKQQRFDRGSR